MRDNVTQPQKFLVGFVANSGIIASVTARFAIAESAVLSIFFADARYADILDLKEVMYFIDTGR